jgi:hypothetical protein
VAISLSPHARSPTNVDARVGTLRARHRRERQVARDGAGDVRTRHDPVLGVANALFCRLQHRQYAMLQFACVRVRACNRANNYQLIDVAERQSTAVQRLCGRAWGGHFFTPLHNRTRSHLSRRATRHTLLRHHARHACAHCAHKRTVRSHYHTHSTPRTLHARRELRRRRNGVEAAWHLRSVRLHTHTAHALTPPPPPPPLKCDCPSGVMFGLAPPNEGADCCCCCGSTHINNHATHRTHVLPLVRSAPPVPAPPWQRECAPRHQGSAHNVMTVTTKNTHICQIKNHLCEDATRGHASSPS